MFSKCLFLSNVKGRHCAVKLCSCSRVSQGPLADSENQDQTTQKMQSVPHLQKHVRKAGGGSGKKSCVSTCGRKPGNTCASLTTI